MPCSGRQRFLASLAFVAAICALSSGHALEGFQPPPAEQGTEAPADPFGAEVTLPEQTIIFMQGSGRWENAYETLVDAFKNVYAVIERQGLKPAGRPMTIYSSSDDSGFRFQAAVPIAQSPKNPPRGDIAVGKSPAFGRVLKFVHRGSYQTIDNTYEAIANFLDEKKLNSKDMFFEEYVTDPLTTPESDLVVNVYVPLQ